MAWIPPVSPFKTSCLLQTPADSVDEEVVGFLSHLKEVKQLRKVEMDDCNNLSPSLIATFCSTLCRSNSVDEVVLESDGVSVLSVSQHHTYSCYSSTVYTLIFAGLNFRSFHRSAAIHESFIPQTLSDITSCKNGDARTITLTNQHNGEQIQLRIPVQTMALHWCHAEREFELAKKMFVSPHVCSCWVVSSRPCVDRQLEDACSFVFGPPKGGMSQIWEGFSTSVAEAGRKEQHENPWSAKI